MKWIKLDEQKPDEHTEVLTLMKHGAISGFYDPETDSFHAYYWRDMEWFATHWMPFPAPPSEEPRT